jgi:hypothetical protein
MQKPSAAIRSPKFSHSVDRSVSSSEDAQGVIRAYGAPGGEAGRDGATFEGATLAEGQPIRPSALALQGAIFRRR